MTVNTRSVPERTLAFLTQELSQSTLEPFIMASFSSLFQYAERNPGLRPLLTSVEWPTYVIYYGPVTPDSSARVDVAIAVDPSAQAEGDIAVRVEPAHQEAFVELTKGGLAFPAILDSYAAVEAWLADGGGAMIADMPSREVYTADVMAAGGDDVIGDVAYPFVAVQK
jgi:hypothetical protein